MRPPSIVLSALLLGAALPAAAGPAADTLSRCLAENTTGKERKQMAKWVWVGMSAHSEIKDLAAMPPDMRTSTDQAMGALVTRLLADNCAAEARTAVRMEGPDAMRSSFGILGRIAMQELMSEPAVSKSFEGFTRYIDDKRLEQALKPR